MQMFARGSADFTGIGHHSSSASKAIMLWLATMSMLSLMIYPIKEIIVRRAVSNSDEMIPLTIRF